MVKDDGRLNTETVFYMVMQDEKLPDSPGFKVFDMTLTSMRCGKLVDSFLRISAFYPGPEGLTTLMPVRDSLTPRTLGYRMQPACRIPQSWPSWLVDENCLVEWTTSPSDLIFRLKVALWDWFRLYGEFDGFYNEQTFAKQVVVPSLERLDVELSVRGLNKTCGEFRKRRMIQA